MKTIRNKVFETNSSSTNSLSHVEISQEDYLPTGDKLIVKFIDTDSDISMITLRDKVSYLVSQIINRYKNNGYDYDYLKEEIERDYDFERIKDCVMEMYKKEVVLPDSFNGDVYKIVNINHQIAESCLDGVLESLIYDYDDKIRQVLTQGIEIEIGHD